MKKKELKEEIKKVLEGKSIYEMSPISGLNPMTKEEIIYWIVETYIDQELDKAREEGFNDGVEKTVGIIQKELDELLLQKDDEKFWVGDILRDCGYSVESILPKNMKGYLVKLKDNK